jgi:hypothetical protein
MVFKKVEETKAELSDHTDTEAFGGLSAIIIQINLFPIQFLKCSLPT